MNKNIALLIIITVIACSELKKERIVELYNDKIAFKIKTSIPDEWSDYANLRSFTDDYLLFQIVKGTKDTSSWILLNIYEHTLLHSKEFNVDSILNWQINLVKQSDSAISIIDKGLKTTSLGKEVGFFDYSYKDIQGQTYCRKVTFYEGKKIAVLEVYSKNDWNRFMSLSDHFIKNLDY